MTSVAPQRCAKSFIQNALKLSETPVPLRLLDIIPPSRWSNVCAVNPFNVISLLVRGNYSAGFSMGIVRSSWSRLLRYSATPCMMSLGSACCIEEAFGQKLLAQGSIIICVSILGGFNTERLGRNCPLTFYHLVGIGATKVLTHVVCMLETISE